MNVLPVCPPMVLTTDGMSALTKLSETLSSAVAGVMQKTAANVETAINERASSFLRLFAFTAILERRDS